MINLTIQSANLKDVEITNLANWSHILTAHTNETVQLSYENYIFEFSNNLSTVTYNNILQNVDGTLNDGALLICLVGLTVVGFGILKIFIGMQGGRRSYR